MLPRTYPRHLQRRLRFGRFTTLHIPLVLLDTPLAFVEGQVHGAR